MFFSEPSDLENVARALRRVAKLASGPAVALPDAISLLVQSRGWSDLVERRGAGYHRWRPQSDGMVGVPLRSPWQQTGPGHWRISGTRPYVDGLELAAKSTAVGKRCLSAVATAMVTLDASRDAVIEARIRRRVGLNRDASGREVVALGRNFFAPVGPAWGRDVGETKHRARSEAPPETRPRSNRDCRQPCDTCETRNTRLLIRRLWVRVPHGPPRPRFSQVRRMINDLEVGFVGADGIRSRLPRDCRSDPRVYLGALPTWGQDGDMVTAL
jgi:hypothetical protein